MPYSAFGDNKPTGVLAQAGVGRVKATVPTVTFNLRFAGQYWDEESNLSYNYIRSYQASQGRYSHSDPIGLAGGLNRFGYVEGNPLSYIDPFALAGLVTAVCIADNTSGAGYENGRKVCDYTCTVNGRILKAKGSCNKVEDENISPSSIAVGPNPCEFQPPHASAQRRAPRTPTPEPHAGCCVPSQPSAR